MNGITSIHNPRIKNAVKLRTSRGRRQQQRIIVDGRREILRAWESGAVLRELFLCLENLSPDEQAAWQRRLQGSDTELWTVTPQVFAKLAYGDRDEGLVAVADLPKRSLESLADAASGLIAVLETVEKPGNLGAVVRSADGAGVSAILLADPVTDIYHPNAIRASLGAIFRVPVVSCTSGEALHWLRERRMNIFAARVGGEMPYYQADLSGHAAVVLGSESDGLSSVWQGHDIVGISLPMHGIADSLNVSTTAAVLFYESLRQRIS